MDQRQRDTHALHPEQGSSTHVLLHLEGDARCPAEHCQVCLCAAGGRLHDNGGREHGHRDHCALDVVPRPVLQALTQRSPLGFPRSHAKCAHRESLEILLKVLPANGSGVPWISIAALLANGRLAATPKYYTILQPIKGMATRNPSVRQFSLWQQCFPSEQSSRFPSKMLSIFLAFSFPSALIGMRWVQAQMVGWLCHVEVREKGLRCAQAAHQRRGGATCNLPHGSGASTKGAT